jgi:hypothetical protein
VNPLVRALPLAALIGTTLLPALAPSPTLAGSSYTVVRKKSLLTNSQLVGIAARYFGYLNAHRYYAAWQLEAPCRVTFSVPNGPGSPVGSESYAGRAPWTSRLPRTANQSILVSAEVASIARLHIPVLDRNHVLAFAVRGWFHFDYSAVGSGASFNYRHKSGFHIVKIAMWQCNGRWGIEPSYWLIAGGGELNWT